MLHKVIHVLFLSVLFSGVVSASDSLKHYKATRIFEPIKIDGQLTESVWASTNALSDFVMNRPIEGGVPTQKTEVRIVYDNTAIYIGAMLYDSAPDSILKELGLRDGTDPSSNSGFTDINADYFRFVFDPYNTRQDAYDFGVYASGIQADSRYSDYLFDAVWESSVKITDKGWCVEIKIPYSAIRFPSKPIQEWAFQITRNIRRNREFQQWSLTPSTAANAQNYWGVLDGIENIKPPLRLSLTPYISVAYEHEPVSGSKANQTYSYRGGADIKYGLDERFTLDMTLLPDFGQVQSDNKRKTLSYEEINYDENRQFFKEGTDIFSIDNLFYSRRIGQKPSRYYDLMDKYDESDIKSNPTESKLINATKLSGRTNEGIGLGFFNAITNNTYAIIKDKNTGLTEKILTEPLANYNVIVADKQWKSNSSVYLINTNVTRTKKFSDSNVTGGGFKLVNKKNTYSLSGGLDYSIKFITDPDGINSDKKTDGLRHYLAIKKTSGTIRWGLSQVGVNPTYDPTDFGYYVTPNRINSNANITFFQFKPYGPVQEGNWRFDLNYSQHYKTGYMRETSLQTNLFILFKSYTAIFGGGGFTPAAGREYDPRLNGRYVNALKYWFAFIGVSTDYRKALALDMEINISNFIKTYLSEGGNFDATLRYRINDKLTLNASSEYNFDPYNFGFTSETDPNIYLFGLRRTNTYINSLAARYIFKNDLSLSIVARHYWFNYAYRKFFFLQDDGGLSPTADIYNNEFDGSYNFFNADLLFSWRFAPGSTLTFSYKNIFDNGTDGKLETASFTKNLDYVFKYPHVQTFSIKVLYYLDYLQLRKNQTSTEN
jgi:hypothetical protein